MLIPLPFHGQSSREDVEAVLTDPSLLAASGKYPLGQNRALFAPESFDTFCAPPAFQELWAAHRDSLCHHPTVIIAMNRTIRDGTSYVNCLTPIPEEWLVEREDQFCRECLPKSV